MPIEKNASALVVEDSPTMRSIIVSMLLQIGFAFVDEAPDGTTAIEKVRRQQFSLIVSDWHMAPMDGLALLKAVRAFRAQSIAPFLFITSERSWGHQTTAKLEGADDFLSKPFTVQQLGAKVSRILARGRLRA